MSDLSASQNVDHGIATFPDMPSYPDVVITIVDNVKRYSLRIKDKHFGEFRRDCDVKLPTTIGSTAIDETMRLYCLGPDEWLIKVNPDEDMNARFEKSSVPLSLVDISHRQIGFAIDGESAVEVINIGCPLDLSLRSFPVGKVTRTIFERAEIMLNRTSESRFEIEIWRSFAPYFLRLIEKGC